jgi:glycyl-tRNA synthetase
MSEPLTFQSMIMNLQDYWAKQGCLIWQPYYTQVGAGTMNPATFLRVLGPEPWDVAYVEPSVRPDDGRYGENPNRLQQHYQFQVILKPDPGNPQELYLRSLEALGIDPRQHDIRFVEDNWESPALGAWGLGWEVWLDGQEITQFTYFQQSGGVVLEPVAVEITYGLDRIAMPLQKVRNFRNIHWSDKRTSGDVNLQAEQEHSKYYFEIADVERLRKMYNLFEEEAVASLDAGLVLPAHDYILKCSHTFNILDTRGAIGVTERQAFFGRMRDLSRRVAELYIAKRQELDFPWLKDQPAAAAAAAKTGVVSAQGSPASEKAPFLFEIGTEELPVADLDSALAQLKERIPSLLNENHLTHGDIRVMGTPRRLVVIVEELASRQPDRESIIKGPPADRAFDASGNPTKAGEGFARSKGIDIKDLKIREMDGGKYASALVHETGKPAVEVLTAALPGLVASIRFDKTMRWNSTKIAFSRPIRWLLAIHGQQVIPFEYAGLTAGNTTRGLRFLEPAEKTVNSVAGYLSYLDAQGIVIDPDKRREIIRTQVEEMVRSAGGTPDISPALLEEVNNLVEAPAAFLGKFDPASLALPEDVLVSVMAKHQRYFPVRGKNGLLPFFVGVRNGDGQYLDIVSDGNAQVIAARFVDASFFVNEDLHHTLESHLPRLGTLTFQLKLGSMLDKSKRVTSLTDDLVKTFALTADEMNTAHRTAELCKADLVTKMVVEMTSLQGIMGRYYALHSNETQPVADAIYEHYLPRFAGDAQPKSKPGLVVGIADRLDSLCGLFAAGLAPTGTKDPFAQRRAAQGLVQNLIAWNLDFDLRAGLKQAAVYQPVTSTPESQAACVDFIAGRLRAALLEQGFRYDIVDAVLAAQSANPAGALRSVKELTDAAAQPDWPTTLQAYARCVRITRDQKGVFSVEPAGFVNPAEGELYAALLDAEKFAPRDSIGAFLKVFDKMIPPINRFFEAVMVMDENPTIRANRLGLLQRVAKLTADAADLSVLEGF